MTNYDQIQYRQRCAGPQGRIDDTRWYRRYLGIGADCWLEREVWNWVDFACEWIGHRWQVAKSDAQSQTMIWRASPKDFATVGTHGNGRNIDIQYFTRLARGNFTQQTDDGQGTINILDSNERPNVAILHVPCTWEFLAVMYAGFPLGKAWTAPKIGTRLVSWGKEKRGVDLNDFIQWETDLPEYEHHKHFHLSLGGPFNADGSIGRWAEVVPPPHKPRGIEISGNELKKIIKAEVGQDVDVTVRDNKYLMPYMADVQEFLREDDTDKYEYVPESFDCDDFSWRLIGNMSVPAYSRYSKGWMDSNYHRFACAVLADDQRFYVVEPQTDAVMPYYMDLGPNYKTPRQVEM